MLASMPPAPATAAPHAPPPPPEMDVLKVIFPALIYISTSASLILLNKYALASFSFQCPNSLLFFHCALAVVLVKVCEMLGYIKVEPLRWQIIKLWFPVNLIFVSMLGERSGIAAQGSRHACGSHALRCAGAHAGMGIPSP